MELSPIDIRNQEFRRKTFGGVDPDEVSAFLRHVSEAFEEQVRELRATSERLETARQQVQHYREIESLLQETAVTLQKVLEEKKAEAQREAELIIAEAKAQAWKEAEGIRREAESLRSELETLRAQRTHYFVRMRNAVRAQQELLEALSEDE